jgi:hypothetical protein
VQYSSQPPDPRVVLPRMENHDPGHGQKLK